MEGYSRVANFIDADNKRWNREVLLSQIDLPLVQAQDKLLWMGESEGKFSVKTSYEVCNRNDNPNAVSGVWKSIWSSKLHEMLKMYLWRLAAKSLPTRMNLRTKLKK